ncbi:hypothetical protein Tco_0753475 [Tanacetum coccineum]
MQQVVPQDRPFARESSDKGNQDSRRRDAWNSGNKDGRRSGKQEDSKALVTIDGEGVDWTSHSEEEEDYALMACNSSGSDHRANFLFKMSVKRLIANIKKNWMMPNRRTTKRNACCTPTHDRELHANWTLYRSRLLTITYGPKQTQPSESETQTSEIDTCESNISTKPPELVSELVVSESNVECQPKVWSDAPIIEEYESDSEDEYVSLPTKEHETPTLVAVGGKRETDVKPSAGCNWRPQRHHYWQNDYLHRALKNKGIVDSGCSRHMTGNKAYLAEYQDFNEMGGHVSTEKDAGDAPNKHSDLKTNRKPVDKEDQVFLDKLERLKRQEKDVNDAAEALRKEFSQQTARIVLPTSRSSKPSSTQR